MIEKLLHVYILPAGCPVWVFMENVPAILKLHLVQAYHEVQMSPAFSQYTLDFVWRHLAEIQSL